MVEIGRSEDLCEVVVRCCLGFEIRLPRTPIAGLEVLFVHRSQDLLLLRHPALGPLQHRASVVFAGR